MARQRLCIASIDNLNNIGNSEWLRDTTVSVPVLYEGNATTNRHIAASQPTKRWDISSPVNLTLQHLHATVTTAASKALYAARHGHTFRQFVAANHTGVNPLTRRMLQPYFADTVPTMRHPSWLRVPVLRALLRDGCEFVLWLDSDVVFDDLDVSLEPLMQFMAAHGRDLALSTWSRNGHNAGIMLLRATAHMDAMLDEWWAQGLNGSAFSRYRRKIYWEQSVLHKHLMMQERHLRHTLETNVLDAASSSSKAGLLYAPAFTHLHARPLHGQPQTTRAAFEQKGSEYRQWVRTLHDVRTGRKLSNSSKLRHYVADAPPLFVHASRGAVKRLLRQMAPPPSRARQSADGKGGESFVIFDDRMRSLARARIVEEALLASLARGGYVA